MIENLPLDTAINKWGQINFTEAKEGSWTALPVHVATVAVGMASDSLAFELNLRPAASLEVCASAFQSAIEALFSVLAGTPDMVVGNEEMVRRALHLSISTPVGAAIQRIPLSRNTIGSPSLTSSEFVEAWVAVVDACAAAAIQCVCFAAVSNTFVESPLKALVKLSKLLFSMKCRLSELCSCSLIAAGSGEQGLAASCLEVHRRMLNIDVEAHERWQHPHLAFVQTPDSVYHGVGCRCLQQISAGAALLYESHPIVIVRGANHVDDEAEAYASRFETAVLQMKHLMWDPLIAADDWHGPDVPGQSRVDCTAPHLRFEKWMHAILQEAKSQLSGTPIHGGFSGDGRVSLVVSSALKWLSVAALHHGNTDAECPESSAGTLTDQMIHLFCDVWQCNAMRMMDASGFPNVTRSSLSGGNDGRYALYALASRLNHNCRPNAVCVFPSNGKDSVVVRAIREIQEGEEVTISYTPLFCSKVDREQWCGFRCACPTSTAAWVDPNKEQDQEGIKCFGCGVFIDPSNARDCAVGLSAQGEERSGCFEHKSTCPVLQEREALDLFLGAATRQLGAIRRQWNELCSGRHVVPMLRLEACCASLSPHHWLRHEICLNTLVIASNHQLELRHSTEARQMLVDVTRRLVETVKRHLSPPPTQDTSGIEENDSIHNRGPSSLQTVVLHPYVADLVMHLVYRLGKLWSQASEQGSRVHPMPMWIQHAEVIPLIQEGFAAHVGVRFGFSPLAAITSTNEWASRNPPPDEAWSQSDTAYTVSFLDTYQVELSAVGIDTVEDLAQLAAFDDVETAMSESFSAQP